ncbi:hypothetical protein [Aminobacter sp. MET-1]|uniref:hypothetical protein n=1 Tax=Aminobacter sp. MET-1 TaxID=2951085 RepID=UPI00226A0AA6|nr:hypothetical protein [Aminobacter sp. MET-1]MCX8571113.1 hypothetical protein [Aminobacter sp. MET-1]MCX8573218.1 hypothetical protein [Aminobacter sp. MET-1]
MKPWAISLNGDILGQTLLAFDGQSIARDSREAMRFDKEEEALAYIRTNGLNITLVGSDPVPQWVMPTGYTHQ